MQFSSCGGNKRQTINCYSGCPSAAELSRIWPFFSIDFSNSNPEEGSTSLEQEDKNLSQRPSLPFDNIEEAAIVPMASDTDQYCGSGSSNPLNEKVRFPCIHAIAYFGCVLVDGRRTPRRQVHQEQNILDRCMMIFSTKTSTTWIRT